jgi:hypothetical protein
LVQLLEQIPVSNNPPLDQDDNTKNVRSSKKTPPPKAPHKKKNSSNKKGVNAGFSVDLLCESISNTSEIAVAAKTNQASQDSPITQMLMFQLFQSQIQSQDCKIDSIEKDRKMMRNSIEKQTKMMGKMMKKMSKQMKQKKMRKKHSKLLGKKKREKIDDV